MLATVGFEVACVFYNALLPAVAPPAYIGRVSGWGWGLGYVGGIVCLAIVLFGSVLNPTPPFGLDRASAEHVRIAGPFSALWYALFALPLFLFVPEPKVDAVKMGRAVREGVADLWHTVKTLRQHRGIAWFLLANMIYTDGLTTLFAFGGIYAAGTFGMTLDEVIMFGIALNLTAGIGGFGFAWIDDRIGARPTVMIGLASLIATGGAMLVIESKATSGSWACCWARSSGRCRRRAARWRQDLPLQSNEARCSGCSRCPAASRRSSVRRCWAGRHSRPAISAPAWRRSCCSSRPGSL